MGGMAGLFLLLQGGGEGGGRLALVLVLMGDLRDGMGTHREK